MELGQVIDWLLAPLSGATDHGPPLRVAWHGRLMVLAWGILAPCGVLVARYLKVAPGQDWPRERDNRLWWNVHRITQYSALVISLGAAWIVLNVATQRTPIGRVHGILGWAVVFLGCAQVLSGWLRGTKGGPTDPGAARGDWHGDHYDMTPRRKAFEYFHKFAGLLAMLLMMLTIIVGLVVADAPRWMVLMIAGWWLMLGTMVAYLQSRGKCLDTYQAIWGLGPEHPGNSMRPIGIGIRQLRSRDLSEPSDQANFGRARPRS